MFARYYATHPDGDGLEVSTNEHTGVGDQAEHINPLARWLQANGPGRFQLASKTGWDTFITPRPLPTSLGCPGWRSALSAEELED